MSNEAAERLAESMMIDAGYGSDEKALAAANAALTAERKATVERIRPDLEEIVAIVDESIAMFQSRGIGFDKWPVLGRAPHGWTTEEMAALDPEVRWQGIAFSVYTDLAKASSKAQGILDAEAAR